MILKLIFFLVVIIGDVWGKFPHCYSFDKTWHSDDVTDVLTGVDNAYVCQESCASSDCSGFTYYTDNHPHFPQECFLFHALIREEECANCVSGPASCTCSASYSCDLTGDNIIDVFPSTQSETQCQNICFNSPECTFYTYFNEENVIEDTCHIFRSCPKIDENCVSCFSGPPVCTSTTTIKPTTKLTTRPTTRPTTKPTTTTPGPCDSISYWNLSAETRNVNYKTNHNYCDGYVNPSNESPDWKGAGWYRISGKAGHQLPQYPPTPIRSSCGTAWPGWLNGSHPQVWEGEVARRVCFNDDSDVDDCNNFYSDIAIINCGQFYVYKLPNTPGCDVRYCGA